MKYPITLIRRPLFPIKTAPTPPSHLPPQSSERDRQSTPFIGATSMVTPPPPGTHSFAERRDQFLR